MSTPAPEQATWDVPNSIDQISRTYGRTLQSGTAAGQGFIYLTLARFKDETAAERAAQSAVDEMASYINEHGDAVELLDIDIIPRMDGFARAMASGTVRSTGQTMHSTHILLSVDDLVAIVTGQSPFQPIAIETAYVGYLVLSNMVDQNDQDLETLLPDTESLIGGLEISEPAT